ncbi:TetR/AcrR family transcriptional regulator [Streptomyces sp. ME02-8801-2C]|uniref:TetR/AcrR family transcriptional regulator n=1 Tax=Streptomyces sp. ME02-8801-2C TaxID=3028680 RepID=UPI0029BAC0E3|nr:TetR/AcrR family transcriptional regulator [Streptomyces sp. ME02-8801-2C]MDX3454309.1 TetR/AcrR family transcriptional regulator [Streptomyces sp. ME02-8801-2C]
MVRMSAEERRESVVRAAIAEFAQKGFYGTSTEVIAKRVGVSQPYLFRLFPDKKAIFAAASRQCLNDVCRVFAEAAEGLEGEEALHSMANAYTRMITEHPERLQMQMQVHITVAAAEAEGDHEFGEAVRDGWMKLWDIVQVPLGDETTTFMAYGMLVNTLAAMGFPPGHRVWRDMYPSARIKGQVES